MFPNPQSAIPLAPNPNIDHYKKLAKELVKACHSESSNSVHSWAARWIENLARLAGADAESSANQWKADVEAFVRKKLLDAPAKKPTLADAQFVIARCHGFESCPKFAKHLQGLARSGPASDFENAAEAIVDGEIAALEELLREHPRLVRMRSDREHGATLLHYVSANGVESYRQRTPQNIVEITGLLLRSGAEVDATAEVYGGHVTTLELVATSVHPERAGVQEQLMDTLLRAGADINRGQNSGGSIVDACLANGRYKAAEFLASRGARWTIESAAGLGRMDRLKQFFSNDGVRTAATKLQVDHAFLWACEYGHNDVVEFLLDHGVEIHTVANTGQTGLHWAVIGGQLHTVKLMLSRGASMTERNMYGSTALGQAVWSAVNGGGSESLQIIETLLEAGSTIDDELPGWLSRQKAPHGLLEEVSGLLRRYGKKP